MNRHFQAYNALPCAPLGEPKGAEKQQASDGEWKPLRPGYESRTLAGGATEVRSAPGYRPDVAPSVRREPAYQPEGFDFAYVDRKGHQSEAIPKRPEPAALAAPEPKQAPAAADVPAAPTEWQSGPPPENGWRQTSELCARYFDGSVWSMDAEIARVNSYGRSYSVGRPALADQRSIRWRGPRLTGDSWPEPQQ